MEPPTINLCSFAGVHALLDICAWAVFVEKVCRYLRVRFVLDLQTPYNYIYFTNPAKTSVVFIPYPGINVAFEIHCCTFS